MRPYSRIAACFESPPGSRGARGRAGASGKYVVEGEGPFCYHNEAFKGQEMVKAFSACLGKMR